MAENLEKEQFFQLHALKFLLVCRKDYCLNNSLLLVRSRDAHHLEQSCPLVLFIMLFKVFLTFETVNETLKCNHSNESY